MFDDGEVYYDMTGGDRKKLGDKNQAYNGWMWLSAWLEKAVLEAFMWHACGYVCEGFSKRTDWGGLTKCTGFSGCIKGEKGESWVCIPFLWILTLWNVSKQCHLLLPPQSHTPLWLCRNDRPHLLKLWVKRKPVSLLCSFLPIWTVKQETNPRQDGERNQAGIKMAPF